MLTSKALRLLDVYYTSITTSRKIKLLVTHLKRLQRGVKTAQDGTMAVMRLLLLENPGSLVLVTREGVRVRTGSRKSGKPRKNPRNNAEATF